MKNFNPGDIAAAAFVVAGLYVMARPNSQGPSLISAVTGGFANIVTASTGNGKWS